MSGFIDAHSHLQDERLKEHLDGVIAKAYEAGITKIVCCGTEEADWPEVKRIKEKYSDLIIPSFGLHPWYIPKRSAGWLKNLENVLTQISSGVGEIGLDFALREYDEDEQKKVFEAQLRLAHQLERPVTIHCRQAWEALMDVLEKSGPLKYGGLVHSYSGAAELIPRLRKFGLSFSFSGSITRSGNKKGRHSLLAVPSESLLVETDSPDLSPVGVEGTNEPAHLMMVVKTVAVLLGKSEEDIIQMTSQNAMRLFGILE
ncbi:MAG: TatD family hydrolase [Candidatus Omnitrophica bacterium]|nr:TatD family hydrolase [Candidatus Omnitrophota bacterium]MDD5670423.1 TatD family hydrolase [Candidatus Omnitrophota bacterium]